MSSPEAYVSVIPSPSSPSSVASIYKPKDYKVVTEELKEKPILRRDNTGLRNFLNDAPDGGQKVGVDGEADSLRFIGRLYTRIMAFSIITRYAFYILPVAIVLGIPLAVFGTVGRGSTIQGVRTMGLFLWLEVIWTSLWVAKLCSKTLPRLFRVCCGVISAGTRKHSLMIKALEVPLSILFWVIISWATIPIIDVLNGPTRVTVNDSPISWIRSLQKAFLASVPVAGVFLVEKTAIEFITVNYHRTQFSARIRAQKRKMHLFELLYEASAILHPPYCAKFADDDYIINQSMLSTVGMNIQGVADIQTVAPRRVFDDLGRLGTGVTSMLGNIVAEVTGGKHVDSKSPHAVVSWALERTPASEALARRVFLSLAEEGSDALYVKDIERVLGADNDHEVEEIFHALDKDGNGDVSLEEMTMMVIELGEGRRATTKSLHDVDRAIKALDSILMVAVVVGAAMIYGTFFSQNFFQNVALYTTSLMSFSFAFAGTVQEFTGSCIFLFSKHPYDVGDRVYINGVDLIVEHISLLYTVFRRVDTNRSVQIPNIVNNEVWIENISRSRPMSESILLTLSPSTTFAEISTVQALLEEFVRIPENKRDYQSDVTVEVAGVGDLSKLEVRIGVGYKSNWGNESLRALRRGKFMCELLAILRKVPIYAPGGGDVALGDAQRPAYSVSVSDEEARLLRTKFFGEKAKAKLVYEKDKSA